MKYFVLTVICFIAMFLLGSIAPVMCLGSALMVFMEITSETSEEETSDAIKKIIVSSQKYFYPLRFCYCAFVTDCCVLFLPLFSLATPISLSAGKFLSNDCSGRWFATAMADRSGDNV